ncbi:MAG: leucine-rich repeat domain-containing protein, partial [Paludibacteraceae bacterium]|nr:leucine-rich repeat domain-containing protein [Paludibacteraceae bacterium]
NIEKVVLNENIRELPNECFKDCRNLKEISMFPLTKFDHSVFEGTEIIDNFNFVYKLPADSLCLHVSDISCTGVTKVDLSEHAYAPQLDLKLGKFEWKHPKPNDPRRSCSGDKCIIDDIKKSVEFIIPAGARKNRYDIGEWEKMHLTEQGSKDTYICELKTTGTLKDYITDDNAPNIKSLTVIGKMDETDVATLRKCISLKYLDISNCFVYQSEEHAKAIFTKEIEKLQMQYAMNKLRKEVYKQRYERAGQDLFSYAFAETMDQYFQGMEIDKITQKDIDEYFHLLCGKEKVIKSDYCWFEKNALYGLDWLEEVKLPNKYVGISYELWGTTKKRLKKVQLSPETQYIGGCAFKGFSRLENINLPNSLQSIGSDAFKGCKLRKVDLTNTQIRTWEGGAGEQYLYLDAFEDNPLLEYRSPKNIENPQKWIETLKWSNTNQGCPITLYMNFKEPFCPAPVLQQIFGEIKELHIPRGMKGAWRGYSNVIDDIDL